MLGAHLLDLITLTNERIAIGMGSRSLSEKIQDYDHFHLLVPQEKWRYWRSRCCQEDDVLKSMLNHIRLLGGRHLREKSYKQVLVIWMLCTLLGALAASIWRSWGALGQS